MQRRIRVRKAQIRPLVEATFPEYRGRTFTIEFTDTVGFYDTNWSGGTRSTYRVVQMVGGAVRALPQHFPPWDNPIEGQRVPLPEDVVVVEHAIFCGKDMGLHLYAHPSRNRLLTQGDDRWNKLN